MITTARRLPAGAMTIEELGARAGLTTRTIRSYQTMGILRGPRKVGRVGYYADDHLERLTAIGRLMQRGFSLASIAALLHAHEQGQTLAQVLGIDVVRHGAAGAEHAVTPGVGRGGPSAPDGMRDGVIDLR